MNKKVMARLCIQVYVDCPNCEATVDLMRSPDTGGIDLDAEGEISSQIFNDGEVAGRVWKSFEANGVKCSRCGKSFDVNGGLDW